MYLFIGFKYTVHWLDIYIVYKTIPLIALPSGSPPSQHINANCIPYAMLPIPMTIYQLLICPSITIYPFLPALQPSSPLALHLANILMLTAFPMPCSPSP